MAMQLKPSELKRYAKNLLSFFDRELILSPQSLMFKLRQYDCGSKESVNINYNEKKGTINVHYCYNSQRAISVLFKPNEPGPFSTIFFSGDMKIGDYIPFPTDSPENKMMTLRTRRPATMDAIRSELEILARAGASS